MAKYRVKQIIVDAAQFDGSTMMAEQALAEAPNGAGFDGRRVKFTYRGGVLAAEPGDWIVKQVDGTFVPMRPADFDKLYEPA